MYAGIPEGQITRRRKQYETESKTGKKFCIGVLECGYGIGVNARDGTGTNKSRCCELDI